MDNESLQWKPLQHIDGISSDYPQVGKITSLQFDNSGQFLFIGDINGSVSIYKSNVQNNKFEYNYFCKFKSHNKCFDYLKSVDIEEYIKQIECASLHASKRILLLTSNEKCIKLWSINEAKKGQKINLRRIFKDGHVFNINSLSANSDQETFISSDELRINLWNIERTDTTFMIVDLLRNGMENVNECITKAFFHPSSSNILAWTTTRGHIKLSDLRSNSLGDIPSLTFIDPNISKNSNYFTDIISSISDGKFSNDGRFLLTRDYINLKLWDVNMDKEPLMVFPVHNHLTKNFFNLYENNHIFDKFQCEFNYDDSKFITGTYDNIYMTFDRNGTRACTSADQQKSDNFNRGFFSLFWPRKRENYNQIPDDINSINYKKKCQIIRCHPNQNIIAAACDNSLYLLNQQKTY